MLLSAKVIRLLRDIYEFCGPWFTYDSIFDEVHIVSLYFFYHLIYFSLCLAIRHGIEVPLYIFLTMFVICILDYSNEGFPLVSSKFDKI